MRRRDLLKMTLAAALVGCRRGGDPASDAVRRGVDWLFGQQTAEGSIPSRTYGLLAGGQSTTPFALRAILSTGRSDPDRVGRALSWMLAARQGGALGLATPALDYPVYATSLLLSCLAGHPSSEDVAGPSVAWLRSWQYGEGWEGHPAHGGFGMGGRVLPTPPRAGHVDLSMTRRAVEGLRAVGVPADDPALLLARTFVHRCRTADGGFRYSPVEEALNKGGKGVGYGSATADGLLALAALGEEDARALAFLKGIHRTDANPNVGDGPLAGFAEAMKGYYRAASARVFARHGGPEGWREAMTSAVLAEQREDGSWIGTSPLQKEDDPILATGFALTALAATISR